MGSRSTACWTAFRTSGSSNGGRELFSNIAVVRGSWRESTSRLASSSRVACDTAGIAEAICTSPVWTCVTLVAPSTMNRTSAVAILGLPPQ
jgi:hypothetical protein